MFKCNTAKIKIKKLAPAEFRVRKSAPLHPPLDWQARGWSKQIIRCRARRRRVRPLISAQIGSRTTVELWYPLKL